MHSFPGRATRSGNCRFRCFPARSGDFPASFLQDSAGSGSRNHRPGTFYSNLDDDDEKKSYIKCLASDETKCDEIFDDSTTKDNLYIIFNHLGTVQVLRNQV